MRHFVIAIPDHPESQSVAQRTIRTGAAHGLTIENFPACTPDTPSSLPLDVFETRYSRAAPARACFMSHSALWELSVREQIPVTIFEHDAVIQAPIPDPLPFNKVINLGKPSWGNYTTPRSLGVGPLRSANCFRGSHAYRVNPHGASDLLHKAKTHAQAVDQFLNPRYFPWLEEYYPWVARCDDLFTTIQKERTAISKRIDNPVYRMI